MKQFIYHNKEWPNFYWDSDSLVFTLGKVRNLQGRLNGKMESLGFKLKGEATLKTLTLNVLKSSEIEGEILISEVVRSSIARHLRMDIQGLIPSDRNTDGVVEMMLDATQNYREPIDPDRLFGWHASLFPGGRSGMYKIKVGDWREDITGPVQVVSGAMGKEKVHFQAPDLSTIPGEMEAFINWINRDQPLDPVIKAGIAHLWFITIHPFDDGNGRIARALSDMLLARADGSVQRYYSMSAQIRLERKDYYTILENTQKGNLDITSWLTWFLNCLQNAVESAEEILSNVIFKDTFWRKNISTSLNDRQKKMLNIILDGFEGKLNSSKWAKINKTSTDTALRDIQDLIEKNILEKEESGGRSTSYRLTW